MSNKPARPPVRRGVQQVMDLVAQFLASGIGVPVKHPNLEPVLSRSLTPILSLPCSAGYTVETKIGQIFMVIGGVCVMFDHAPLVNNIAAINALRRDLAKALTGHS